MKKLLTIALALLLPSLLLTGIADAAPKSPTGSVDLNYGESEFPVTYPSTGNVGVKNVAFDVVGSNLGKFDRSGLVIECYDGDRLVYDGQATIAYDDFDKTAFQVSFYVSLSTPWRGEPALCDVWLIWESWNRKTLFQPGGTMDVKQDLFWIGA